MGNARLLCALRGVRAALRPAEPRGTQRKHGSAALQRPGGAEVNSGQRKHKHKQPVRTCPDQLQTVTVRFGAGALRYRATHSGGIPGAESVRLAPGETPDLSAGGEGRGGEEKGDGWL